MPDRVGQQIGNYRLVKLLGKGGFAEVYLGQHVHIDSRQAAIKILYLQDVDARRFREEANTTAKLEHPHIIRLLDFAIGQDGTPFLVLDYAPGGSLRTRHPKGSKVPLARVGEYLKQIAPALQYAHDQHIIHRDIKPENMLIGRKGEILLSDFGIAVLTQTGRTSLATAYSLEGTPYYMAPETYRGKPEKASDQYSLAVVIYEWLCGSVPFSGGDFIQLGFIHASEPVPSLREKNPAIPSDVEAVIFQALSKGPKDRFASVAAFAHAFEQASARLSTGTRVYTYTGHSHSILHITWSPDSLFIASQASDAENSLHIWEALTGRILATFNSGAGVAWSPDGTRIAFCGVKPEILAAQKAALSVHSDDVIDIYDLSVSKITFRYDDPKVELCLFDIAWAPDGKHIAAANNSDNSGVKVWNAVTGDLVTDYREHRGRIYALAWLPDGKHVVSGGENNNVHLWNIVTGKTTLIYRGHSSLVTDVAASPDSAYIASADKDKTIHVWDAASGQAVCIYRDHRESVQSVTWSPDSKLVASASHDNTVHIWEVPKGRRLFTYPGHSDGVLAVAWSPNGQFIASAGRDNTVQVWQVM